MMAQWSSMTPRGDMHLEFLRNINFKGVYKIVLVFN